MGLLIDGGLMFNGQYGDPNISKLLQLGVILSLYNVYIIFLLVNIDLSLQSQCILFTYP